MKLKTFTIAFAIKETEVSNEFHEESDINTFLANPGIEVIETSVHQALAKKGKLLLTTTCIWYEEKGSSQTPLSEPTSSVDWTTRTKKFLDRAELKTIGDICKKSAIEMSKYKGCGKKSIQEIEDRLANLGLKLRDPGPGTNSL